MEVTKRKLGFIFLDVLCINLSLILAFLIRYEGVIPQRHTANLWAMCLIASAIGIGAFHIFQLYNSLWRYASINEMFMIGFACLAAC